MRWSSLGARALQLAAGLALLLPASSFAQVPKPTAKVTRFDIEQISLRDVTFLFDVAVKNPYPVSLSLEALRLTFIVEGAQVAQVQTDKGFSVKAMGTKTSRLLATLRYEEVMAAVKGYAEKDYLNTLVKTQIAIPLPKMPGLPPRITFSYDLKSKIPAIKPRVSITHFKIDQPSGEAVGAALKKAGRSVSSQGAAVQAFKDVLAGKTPKGPIQPKDLDLPLTVSFDIELANETRAPLSFTGLDYRFSVNDMELLTGATKDISRKGNLSTLAVTSRFSSLALSGGLLEALRARRGRFSLSGSTSLKLPDEIRKEPLKLEFTEVGSFNLP
jgi:LEA14-like dessication related protein